MPIPVFIPVPGLGLEVVREGLVGEAKYAGLAAAVERHGERRVTVPAQDHVVGEDLGHEHTLGARGDDAQLAVDSGEENADAAVLGLGKTFWNGKRRERNKIIMF